MTSDTQIYKDRCHIFKTFLLKLMTVTECCLMFGRSRTWFYKWLHRYEQYGEDGLKDIVRRKPAMPNQTPIDIEMKILDYVEQYPSYGNVRISDELTNNGIPVKRSAVYNVLRRLNLNTRKQRLEHFRIKTGLVAKPTDLDREREMSKYRSLDTRYPGHIIGLDVFYVGTLKGVGRIYQFTAIDTYSSFAWAKLYTDKTAISACDFMMHINNNMLEIPIESVLTDNGKEFTTHHSSKNHSFERLLTILGNIKHRLTKIRSPWTNGACERLNRTILEEFYQISFRSKIYNSIHDLNADLDLFIEFYNFKRTHHGKRTMGNVPARLFLILKAA